MGKYFIKRLTQTIPVLLIITLVVFLLVNVAGDPTATMLPPDASPEAREALKASLGLDKPVFVQYGVYMRNLLKGNFGTSFRYNQDALKITLERIPASLKLAGSAFALSVVIAVPLGILSARARNSFVDLIVSGLSVLGQAMPSFWIAIMFILLFAINLKWFPVSGPGNWRYLVLPSVTLAVVTAAQIIPLIRSSMIDIMHEDYIRTARSKGVAERIVVFKHAFKNALIPVVTIMALQIPHLIGGSLITETVFSWPGLGLLIVASINGKDMCVVQACVIVITLITVSANLLADFLYCAIDPRVKYQ